MKDLFESKIKSLVEDFSYDYDPKAWDALSKKLPKTKPGLSWLGKFGIASMLALVVGIIGWNLASNNDTKESAKRAKNVTASQKAAAFKSKSEKKSNWKFRHYNKNANVFLKNNENGKGTLAQTNSTSEQSLNTGFSSASRGDWRPKQTTANELDPFTSAVGLPSMSTPLSPEIVQHNPSTRQLIVADPTPNIQISSNCQGPKLLLDVDAINYEEGTPRIRVNLETNGSDITWSANGTLVNKKSRSVDLMAFKGQTYTIIAEGLLDGCKSTEKIKVTAYEDYNLLAVNAFNPESRDERNATFMPYALTIREVRFELLVLDPENGAVVFRTTDAQNAWDGIDQRTGQLVPAQKAYIWKVVLKEALPNEKTTYSGTIVRI
jgi:hypothetical protein